MNHSHFIYENKDIIFDGVPAAGAGHAIPKVIVL